MTFVCRNNAVLVYLGYRGDQRSYVPYVPTARLKVGRNAAEGLGRGLVEARYIERLQESIHRPSLFPGLRRPRDADRQLGDVEDRCDDRFPGILQLGDPATRWLLQPPSRTPACVEQCRCVETSHQRLRSDPRDRLSIFSLTAAAALGLRGCLSIDLNQAVSSNGLGTTR
jgi:hypothetical protein